MPIVQSILSIPSHGFSLHGLLYRPADASCNDCRAIIICDPFAEEKKCAHRPLTDTARALAEANYNVLRFDYRGCGDSPGGFGDVTPHDWAQDISSAVDFVRGELAPSWLCLAGLRMGAALADEVAASRTDVDALILWEPVIDGRRYVTQNLRRSMIKAMLTEGEGFDAQSVAQRHEAELVDFDGYPVSATMREQLEAIKLGGTASSFGGAVLVLNIGPRDEPAEAYKLLAATYSQGTVVGVRLEPFWNRIGLIDVGALITASLEWLDSLVGDR